MIARRLAIRGRVQEVGFRYTMVDAAADAGVVGWVRNLRDGSVEAFVQGSDDAVARIVTWAHRGPAAASVTSVAVTEEPVDMTLVDFRALAT